MQTIYLKLELNEKDRKTDLPTLSIIRTVVSGKWHSYNKIKVDTV